MKIKVNRLVRESKRVEYGKTKRSLKIIGLDFIDETTVYREIIRGRFIFAVECHPRKYNRRYYLTVF